MDSFPTLVTTLLSTPAPARADVALFEDHAVVRVEGELDMAAWPVLTAARAGLGDRTVPVVVDVADVTFLDCEGLRALLALSPDDEPVTIVGAGRAVRVLLDAAARRDLLGTRSPHLAVG